MMRRTMALGAAVLFTMSACGGSDGGDADATTTTETAETTAASTDAATTVPDTTVPDTAAPESVAAETSAPDTAVPASALIPADGVAFTDPDGVYSVVFPAEPERAEQPQTLPDGSTATVVVHGAQVDNNLYVANCLLYPDTIDLTRALGQAQDLFASNVSGEVVETADVEVQGRPGVRYSGTAELGFFTALNVRDDMTVCTVFALSEDEIADTETAFLDSFAFLEPGP